jgi:hypothetical protein
MSQAVIEFMAPVWMLNWIIDFQEIMYFGVKVLSAILVLTFGTKVVVGTN